MALKAPQDSAFPLGYLPQACREACEKRPAKNKPKTLPWPGIFKSSNTKIFQDFRKRMIKPPRNTEVGLAQSKKTPEEQNMSWGNIQLLAHRCLWHLPTNSLTICYSGLKSCNHKHLFLAPLPTARLPCAAHCYKFDLGIGQTGGGRDGGVVFQQDCFPWLIHSTESSAGTKQATAETIWGTFSTWPQVGGATPAQLLQARQSTSLKKALLCSSREGISFCIQLNGANCCSSSPQLTRTNSRSKTGLLELLHIPLTCLVF